MAVEVLDNDVYAYFTQLTEAEKKSVLQIIKIFIENRRQGFERISIEEYNKQIDEAMERVKAGEFTTIEDLEKEMETW